MIIPRKHISDSIDTTHNKALPPLAALSPVPIKLPTRKQKPFQIRPSVTSRAHVTNPPQMEEKLRRSNEVGR